MSVATVCLLLSKSRLIRRIWKKTMKKTNRCQQEDEEDKEEREEK